MTAPPPTPGPPSGPGVPIVPTAPTSAATDGPSTARIVFDRLPLPERQWVLRALRQETVGGVLLLVATVIALTWANSPWGDSYATLANTRVGPESLHLDLTLATWAADGLLAVFFYVAGVELKHELTLGSLSKPSQAAVPVVAALGGMTVPALIFVAVNISVDDGSPSGWGIPMATDIAFALAVLAVVGSGLPVALRAFLLSLAVVDDLGAILVIAIFYSSGFTLRSFLVAVGLLVVYALLQRARVRSAWLYVPVALLAWYFMHDSGIHATIAGVALGLLTRVRPDEAEKNSPGERMEHLIRPLSAGFCVPVFAFFAAGVDLRDTNIGEALTSPVAIGIMVGLVVGKPLGIVGGAWLMARFTRASLSPSLRWADVIAVGLLAGIGFTVALLIDELAYAADPARLDAAKLAVLTASLLAAVFASIALLARNKAHRALREIEERDEDGDGIPDVYQQRAP